VLVGAFPRMKIILSGGGCLAPELGTLITKGSAMGEILIRRFVKMISKILRE